MAQLLAIMKGKNIFFCGTVLVCTKFITFKENCEADSVHFAFTSNEAGLTMLTTRHLKSLHVLWKMLFDN